MPVHVRMPDGKVAQFPDGMDPKQIEMLIRQHVQQSQSELTLPPDKPSLWDRINTPLASSDKFLGGSSDADLSAEMSAPPSRWDEAHPILGAARKGLLGLSRDTGRTEAGFTSPLSLATIALGGGAGALSRLAPAARTLAMLLRGGTALSGAAIAGQGASQALTPSPDTETDADSLQRRLQGGAAVAGGLGLSGAATRGIAPKLGSRLVRGESTLSPNISPWLSGAVAYRMFGHQDPGAIISSILGTEAANRLLRMPSLNRAVGSHLMGPQPTPLPVMSPLEHGQSSVPQPRPLLAQQVEVPNLYEPAPEQVSPLEAGQGGPSDAPPREFPNPAEHPAVYPEAVEQVSPLEAGQGEVQSPELPAEELPQIDVPGLQEDTLSPLDEASAVRSAPSQFPPQQRGTVEVNEDNALLDKLRSGMDTDEQALLSRESREFAGRNKAETPKGVLQEMIKRKKSK